MAEKLQPDDLREKSDKELQRILDDLQKGKAKAVTEASQQVTPEESIGTYKRNIARVKTILNERRDAVANSRRGGP